MPRLAVALVWLYQGLWCKLLGRCPGHRAIVWRGSRRNTALHILASMLWIYLTAVFGFAWWRQLAVG